jgi:hypothetical protein
LCKFSDWHKIGNVKINIISEFQPNLVDFWPIYHMSDLPYFDQWVFDISEISFTLMIDELTFTVWNYDIILSLGLGISSIIEITIPAFWKKSTILQLNKR